MSEEQWAEELVAALAGTDWALDWYGVTGGRSECLADVRNRLTGMTKPLELLPDVFRTPESRRATIQRQLSI